MTPERWRLIRSIFDEVVELPPREIAGFLEQQCPGDTALLDEVRAMVGEYQRSGILDHDVWSPAPAPVERPAAEPTLFAPGDFVARYKIVRYISRGGMGAVYEAEHPLLPVHVALKSLLPAIANDAAMISRFKREIGLALKIAHPNVCRAFDLESHQSETSGPPVYFLTMEYLDGDTLSQRISACRRLSATEALPILRQIAAGLAAAHAVSVVHGDLKPSNVMLVASRAVVTDFGLARSVRPEGPNADAETTLTLSNAVAGTLDYMAPEMLRGAPASVQSDVYALGMVAYKMVVGALPFVSDGPLAAAFRRTGEAVPSPRVAVPELDSRLESVILGALEIDLERRFRTVSEFLAALESERARGDSSFTRPLLPIPWQPTRRKAMAGAGALAAVAVGGVGAWEWMWNRNRPSPEADRLYQQGVDDIHAGAYFAATKALERAVQSAPGFAPARARLAEAWLELGQPERAAREFLVVRRAGSFWLTKAERLQIEALDLMLTREFPAAAKKYEELAASVGEQNGGVQVDLGRTYEKATQNDKALEAYKRAASGPMHLPAAWLRLGVLYQQRKEKPKSDEAFREAERGYAQSSNLEGLTEVTLQRGIAANRSFQYADAEALLGKAIERARDAGNVPQEISAKLTLANVQYAQGRADRAEALAQEALSAAQANQLEYLSIRGLLGLGNSLRAKGDFVGAQRYFENALGLAIQTKSALLAAQSRLNLASLFDQLHRAQEQIEAAGAALEYYKPNHFARETFQGLTIQGRGQEYLGNYPAAMDAFRRLLEEATRASDKPSIATAHQGLSAVSKVSEDLPKALEQGTLFLASASDVQVGYAARDCASLLARLGRHEDAVRQLKRAEALVADYPALGPSVTKCRAEMALIRNQYQDAMAACSEGMKLRGASPLVLADFTRVLGLARVRSGNAEAGLAKCEEASKTALELGDSLQAISATLAVIEGVLAVRDIDRATTLLRGVEPKLDSFPESKWFALALLARYNAGYRDRARIASETIRDLWGQANLETYLRRPDLRDLAKSFS